MPAPANISQRFRQMLDDAWDAKQLGIQFTDVDVFVVAGDRVIIRMDFEPPQGPIRPENYARITSWLKWPPS